MERTSVDDGKPRGSGGEDAGKPRGSGGADDGKPRGSGGEGTKEKEPERAFVFSTEPRQLDIERRVARVYDVFDPAKLRLVDIKEVPLMIRALELCPTEAQLTEITQQLEEAGTKGQVKAGTFIRVMTSIIMAGTKYLPYTKDDILRFFYKLDRDRRGTVDSQKLRDILCREGEPLSYEEIEEMISFATNKDTGLIHYEEYVDKLIAALRTKTF